MSDYRPLGVIGFPTSIGVATTIPVAAVGGVLMSRLTETSGGALTGNGTAYFCCVGFRPAGEIVKRVKFGVSVKGAGTQTAEVAVAYSLTPPDGSAKTLTKVWADGALDNIVTAAGVFGNASDNTVVLPCDAYVWLGLRTALGTTQPTVHQLQHDWTLGWITADAGVAALTSLSTYTATPIIFANTGPNIRGYL